MIAKTASAPGWS